eukprot:7522767-Pyramimonas_sp.AAC.1
MEVPRGRGSRWAKAKVGHARTGCKKNAPGDSWCSHCHAPLPRLSACHLPAAQGAWSRRSLPPGSSWHP